LLPEKQAAAFFLADFNPREEKAMLFLHGGFKIFID
jgi:hypothetical protein